VPLAISFFFARKNAVTRRSPWSPPAGVARIVNWRYNFFFRTCWSVSVFAL